MTQQTITNADQLARRAAALPRGVGQAHPVVAQRALNAEVWDVEGRRYIDFVAGIAVVNTGHNNPRVLAAVAEQMKDFTHTCFQVLAYDGYISLCERLNARMPGPGAKKSFLMNSGAEAVENAVKVARAATGRPGIIAFNGGFHGRTMFTLGLTGKVDPYKIGFGPFSGDVYHAPFPNPLHGLSTEDALAGVEALFKFDIEASRVAAFIVEPVQGEGGYLPAPAPFLRGLREIADRHGILIIADEIQSGVCRTGKFYGIEHSGVAPDIITMAKGLGGGFPIAAVVGRAEVMDAAAPGGLGGTYGGNPLACAAALTVLDIVDDEQLCEKVQATGRVMLAKLDEIAAAHPDRVAEVRGLGAMLAIEFGTQDGAGHWMPDGVLVKAIVAEARARGLLILSCGPYGNVIRLMPPLTIDAAALAEGLALLAASVDAAIAAAA